MHTSSFSKRFIAFFTTAILALSFVLTSSAAAVRSGTQTVEFVPTSKADYIKSVAEAEGISEAEVLYRLESKKEAFLAEYGVDDGGVAPYNFDGSHYDYIGDGVTRIYGYVYFLDTYAGSFTVRSTCPAVIAQHHYGASFYSVDSGDAAAYADSNGWGNYEPISCQAYDTNTTLTIDYNGYVTYDVDASVSVSADILKFFGAENLEFGVNVGSTYHLRQYVSNSNTYTINLPSS